MGVGAGFWEHLGAVKVEDDLSSLRGKTLAVDLSYWLVQQQTALKGQRVLKPHLRLTFYRAVNLVARVGARPVFVVDGVPPALKQAVREKRSKRFLLFPENRHLSSSDEPQNSVHGTGGAFKESVEECVLLLKHLGIPVLRAGGEAESLCAELNRQGLVDFCVTPDGDAFVHGARSVIKNFQSDLRDPLVELYRASDIQEKLGLEQKHLLALALLVGCDYSPEGVPGVGLNNALKLIRRFPESEILDRLRAWGQGELPLEDEVDPHCDYRDEEEDIGKKNLSNHSHCSKCGHPGNKASHVKSGCSSCGTFTDAGFSEFTGGGCNEKAKGFKCTCGVCTMKVRQKERSRSRGWWRKICSKMAATPGFPNEEIIDVYLTPDFATPEDVKSITSLMTWQPPNMEELESFLESYLVWDTTYIRQKTLPLLTYFCLTELAAINAGTANSPSNKGQFSNLFSPRSIKRVKIDHSEQLFMLEWESVKGSIGEQWLGLDSKPSQTPNLKKWEKSHSQDLTALDGTLNIGQWSFTTNENMGLVRAACPELAEAFDKAQAAKRNDPKKSAKRKRGKESKEGPEQRIISSYFRVDHNPHGGRKVVKKPHGHGPFSSGHQLLDTPGAANWPGNDTEEASEADHNLDPSLDPSPQFKGPSLPLTTTLSGSSLSSAGNVLSKKMVSRKLSFA